MYKKRPLCHYVSRWRKRPLFFVFICPKYCRLVFFMYFCIHNYKLLYDEKVYYFAVCYAVSCY